MHRISLATRLLMAAPVLLTLAFLPVGSSAQKPSSPVAPKKTTQKSKSKPKSANLKTGEIAAIDAAAESLSLKEKTGVATYSLMEKTRYLRNRHEAQLSDFKVGDTVAIRLRKIRNQDAYAVFELYDPDSYTWMSNLRKSTTTAVLKEIGEDTLTATVGKEELVYSISDKTRWQKEGKEVAPTEFKAGQTVTIVPRALPSGSIMARIVADNAADAAKAKEAMATTAHGVLKSLDLATHKLVLTGTTGERSLSYTEGVEVRQRSKPVPFTALHSGLRVSVKIKRDELGGETATRITIEKTERRPPKKK